MNDHAKALADALRGMLTGGIAASKFEAGEKALAAYDAEHADEVKCSKCGGDFQQCDCSLPSCVPAAAPTCENSDLVERVAEGIWNAYMASPMHKPDYDGLSWASIREGAKTRPLIADVYATGLSEARAAIALARAPHPAAVTEVRANCAKLIFDYYTQKIGTLMHQAEHWALPAVETPGAVHHRLMAADQVFQIVCHFDPARLQQGWDEPFAEIEKTLARRINLDPGKYPPSVGLDRYRDVKYVVERLASLSARGKP